MISISSTLKKPIFGIPAWVYIISLSIAFLSQAGAIGYPRPDLDQQYYMYGGGQILKGQVPYIDFWDRKPVGLYLLFAAFHWFGDYRFAVSVITAIASIWIGGCGLLQVMRGLNCSIPAMVGANIFFISSFAVWDAYAGQTEDYFIPLVIWGVALPIIYWESISQNAWKLFLIGCLSMFLFGIALEIKPTTVWDGILVGLLLLYRGLYLPLSKAPKTLLLLLMGICWIALATTPTLIICYWYLKHGYIADWIFANITSFPLKKETRRYRFWRDYFEITFTDVSLFAPALVVAIWFKRKIHSISHKKLAFITLWAFLNLLAALYMTHSGLSRHYSVQAIAPFAILIAVLWRINGLFKIYLASLAILFCTFGLSKSFELSSLSDFGSKTRARWQQITMLLNEQPGCLFEPHSSLTLYDTSKATSECRVTKYSFPFHLLVDTEKDALGVDPLKEVTSILDKLPLYIAYSPQSGDPTDCSTNIFCDYSKKKRVWDRQWGEQELQDKIRYTLDKFYTKIATEPGWNNRPRFVLYKLKPGLIPKIVPPGYPVLPSIKVKPVHFSADRKKLIFDKN